MKLSELVTGQEAYITGVSGKGAIKKRINEMGFIAGRKVKAIKSAPLKDPVEYNIMGYELTIRQKDAAMISIQQTTETPENINKVLFHDWKFDNSERCVSSDSELLNESKTINVALVGNPNCGKTTIFNFATNSKERVANYSGVTVAAKEAKLEIDDYTLNIIDLPGTYSLSSYSPEEMFVTDYLLHNKPDVVINVVDSGNIERNLFLTTQLLDAGLKTVVALNMYDELETEKASLDYIKLGDILGIPFVPTVGIRGKGLKELFSSVIKVHVDWNSNTGISYIDEIETALSEILNEIDDDNIAIKSNRLVALQLLEGEQSILSSFPKELEVKLFDTCKEKRIAIEKLLRHDLDTEIINLRYGYIESALSETFTKEKIERISITQKIDKILTHKIWGLPIFFGIMWFIFYSTFKIGETPMSWIDNFVIWTSESVSNLLPQGILNSLIVDGVIGGVGGVVVFLPNIIILFLLISVMEDSGYMARTAFLMDKVMNKAGLHGKSFIPLLMGFGCNVPAIMATRTIESKRDRLVTMFITPFMSCSARLPVYVLFISAFFPRFESIILFSMYAIGIIAALLTAIILNKTIFRKTESPFIMELPPYRQPTLKAVSKQTWFKTTHFLKKMGTVILLASVLIWALGYFPRDKEIIEKYDNKIAKQRQLLKQQEKSEISKIHLFEENIDQLNILKQSELLEQSYISRVGKAIQPVFAPLGFDWKMSVSILTGVIAKEVVVSSMGLLYFVGGEAEESLVNKLRTSKEKEGTPLITYFGFLVFTLLYFPCMGTLIAIKKETAKYKWVLFSAIYPLLFAWITTFLIYQIGTLL